MKNINNLVIWEEVASIKIIDEKFNPPRWRTIGKCLDTPNAIDHLAKKLTKKGYKNLWAFTCLGKKML